MACWFLLTICDSIIVVNPAGKQTHGAGESQIKPPQGNKGTRKSKHNVSIKYKCKQWAMNKLIAMLAQSYYNDQTGNKTRVGGQWEQEG